MRDRIDLASELAPSAILGKLLAEAGWRDSNHRPVFPYDPGAHRVFVRVRRNRFRIAISGKMLEKVGGLMYRNSFAPVCVGTVEELSDGGSRIRAGFRLNWVTRLFATVWFGGIAWAIVIESANRYRHPSGYFSPPVVEAILYGVGLVLLCSPLIGLMLGFVVLGTRWGPQRIALRETITRVSRSSATATAAHP